MTIFPQKPFVKECVNTVTSIDKPRCSRCGEFKKIDELNGLNPLAPIGQQYKNAYCRKIVNCESYKSNSSLSSLVNKVI